MMGIRSTDNVFSVFTAIVLILNLAFAGGHWIDPDTPQNDALTQSIIDGTNYKLVFSDEFNIDDRLFIDGFDPRWTAINKNDYTNFALHYYNESLATTSNGYLKISSQLQDVQIKYPEPDGSIRTETKIFQSGMIQGWNKFCFTGGIVDVSAKLPGTWDIGGLWPAMWLLGNLARATYVGSSNNMWPWSFDQCEDSLRSKQDISSCNSVNHYGLHPHQGRGAPEIDILEAMSGNEALIYTKIRRPYFSTSLQIAPGIQDYRPNSAEQPDLSLWYNHGVQYHSNDTDLNIFFYGAALNGPSHEQDYIADALSANTNLNSTHFEEFHNFRSAFDHEYVVRCFRVLCKFFGSLEWEPGPNGYLRWFLDGEYLYSIDGNALNVTGAMIPQEPMYLLFNTAVSSTWGFPYPCPDQCDCTCLDPRKPECSCALPDNLLSNFPAAFLIDYVRVYQREDSGDQSIGCSPPDYPTRQYIEGHVGNYMKDDDEQPLRPISVGGGRCNTDSDCEFGSCVHRHCACWQNFTGPTCKASIAFDDVTWAIHTSLGFSYFYAPHNLVLLFLFLCVAFIGVVVYTTIVEKRRKASFSLVYKELPSDGVGEVEMRE